MTPPTTPAELRAFRKTLGITQLTLASALGISRRSMVRYETQVEPLPHMLTLACGALYLLKIAADRKLLADRKPPTAH